MSAVLLLSRPAGFSCSGDRCSYLPVYSRDWVLSGTSSLTACAMQSTSQNTLCKYSEEKGIAKMSIYVFRLEDATSLITLYHMLHPECQSAKEAKEGKLQGIDLIKVSFSALNYLTCRRELLTSRTPFSSSISPYRRKQMLNQNCCTCHAGVFVKLNICTAAPGFHLWWLICHWHDDCCYINLSPAMAAGVCENWIPERRLYPAGPAGLWRSNGYIFSFMK